MAAPDTLTAASPPALVADTAFRPTLVRVGLNQERATARWTTSDGHLVYRTGQHRYWVADRDGRWAMHNTLAQVRADVVWLRERGR